MDKLSIQNEMMALDSKSRSQLWLYLGEVGMEKVAFFRKQRRQLQKAGR
jgi:hypothetical protein